MSSTMSRLDEKVSRIAEHVEDLGREAADTLDHARNETAGGLHAAASSIRKGGRQGSKAIEDVAEGAASSLDEVGSYIKKHDLKRTVRDSRELVRRYPAESLVLAGGVGLLAGLAIWRLAQACGRGTRERT
jgi:hypothetical protein